MQLAVDAQRLPDEQGRGERDAALLNGVAGCVEEAEQVGIAEVGDGRRRRRCCGRCGRRLRGPTLGVTGRGRDVGGAGSGRCDLRVQLRGALRAGQGSRGPGRRGPRSRSGRRSDGFLSEPLRAALVEERGEIEHLRHVQPDPFLFVRLLEHVLRAIELDPCVPL